MRVLVEPGQVIEVRILKAGRAGTVSGYFDDPEHAGKAAAKWNGKAPGIYVTLNPVNPALLARAKNRLIERADTTTSDTDIERCKWLFIDFDPVRPKGISSTDAEHWAAIERARSCRDWLFGMGWPAPVEADSGNGAHLLYAIDLPNDRAATRLVERTLKALDFQFTDATVAVDTTTFNAARICKLYGTLSAKGDSTAERPHRLSSILAIPDLLTRVPVDLLEALAATVPQEPTRQTGSDGHHHGDFDLDQWIAEHNLPVATSGPWGDKGRRWVLNPCPWNAEHTDRAAYIVQLQSGEIAASCWHNGCRSAGRNWHSLRDLYEPDRKTRGAAKGTRRGKGARTAKEDPAVEDRRAGQPVFRCLADVEPLAVRWLHRGWIPYGAISLLLGDPGEGKSLLTVDYAARVSRGLRMPPEGGGDPDRGQEGVLIMADEDSIEHTIVPRLIAAGADRSRIFEFATVLQPDGDEADVIVPADLDLAEELIREKGIKLVIIDPLGSYLGSGVDPHKDAQVRRVLRRLGRLAQRTGVAILAIMHLNKSTLAPAKYRGQGSIAFLAAARSAFLLARHPENPQHWVIAPVKCNLGAEVEPLTFEIRVCETDPEIPVIAWGEGAGYTLADLLSSQASKPGQGHTSKVDECGVVIETLLANGPVLSEELEEACRNAGFSEWVYKQARKKLRVESYRDDYRGPWFSRLPGKVLEETNPS